MCIRVQKLLLKYSNIRLPILLNWFLYIICFQIRCKANLCIDLCCNTLKVEKINERYLTVIILLLFVRIKDY